MLHLSGDQKAMIGKSKEFISFMTNEFLLNGEKKSQIFYYFMVMNSNNLSYRTRTSILLLKFINNSWRENKGNHYRERGLDVWFYNYHKIQWTFALIFSKNCQCFEKLYLSNTRKSVSSDTQTLRSWFKKKLGCALFFQSTSQCLDIWWNTLPCGWYITAK